MRKLIYFKQAKTIKDIQEYANKHHNGNFTTAVIELINKGLYHETN